MKLYKCGSENQKYFSFDINEKYICNLLRQIINQYYFKNDILDIEFVCNDSNEMYYLNDTYRNYDNTSYNISVSQEYVRIKFEELHFAIKDLFLTMKVAQIDNKLIVNNKIMINLFERDFNIYR